MNPTPPESSFPTSEPHRAPEGAPIPFAVRWLGWLLAYVAICVVVLFVGVWGADAVVGLLASDEHDAEAVWIPLTVGMMASPAMALLAFGAAGASRRFLGVPVFCGAVAIMVVVSVYACWPLFT